MILNILISAAFATCICIVLFAVAWLCVTYANALLFLALFMVSMITYFVYVVLFE